MPKKLYEYKNPKADIAWSKFNETFGGKVNGKNKDKLTELRFWWWFLKRNAIWEEDRILTEKQKKNPLFSPADVEQSNKIEATNPEPYFYRPDEFREDGDKIIRKLPEDSWIYDLYWNSLIANDVQFANPKGAAQRLLDMRKSWMNKVELEQELDKQYLQSMRDAWWTFDGAGQPERYLNNPAREEEWNLQTYGGLIKNGPINLLELKESITWIEDEWTEEEQEWSTDWVTRYPKEWWIAEEEAILKIVDEEIDYYAGAFFDKHKQPYNDENYRKHTLEKFAIEKELSKQKAEEEAYYAKLEAERDRAMKSQTLSSIANQEEDNIFEICNKIKELTKQLEIEQNKLWEYALKMKSNSK
ncbi:hypothetical protein CK556_02630 [Mesoplasma chauliocola]|uniref:Uncharacterized protein n=1 Tax=Mesoplasma chauliocola TaxID=216427 RepID=A0A249SNI7_9MOLU|nr:hypothetical protein [Mesoplasma chauliocola]ASZ09235.1 hypothetical protein CK556_02630 [Mesoplasma chauliocola]